MMESQLGEDKMRKALQDFLKKYKHSTATTDNLLETLKESTGQEDLPEIYNYWIQEPGFPVIEVIQKDNNVTLKQKRFLLRDAKVDSK